MGSVVGVCYGRVGNNLPPPSEVVSLLKSKSVLQVRIYDTDTEVLEAFRGSGIKLTVGLENDALQQIAGSPAAAADWVRRRIVPYASYINYISVGNEVFASNPDWARSYLVAAMWNVYGALQSESLSESIKVSTAHAYNVVEGYPPSQGRFNGAVRDTMNEIVKFLSTTNAPFFVHVYPYFSYTSNMAQISLSYALFSDNTVVVDSNKLQYKSLFDAQVDTVIAAVAESCRQLSLQNVPDVVVTEVGWPTAGDSSGVASVANAKAHNTRLVASVKNGTPRRPNTVLTAFIFALFNENEKPGPAIERNFGLFYPDKTPVYEFNFL